MGNIKAVISHGTEWIDTGYLPKSSQIITIDYLLKSYVRYRHLIGASYDYNRRLLMQQDSASAMVMGPLQSGTGATITTPDINVRTLAILGGGISAFDGTSVESITATKPLLLFGGYYHEVAETGHSACEFYGCKIVDGVTLKLVRNYVPWLDSNNVPCVKDLATNTLYYNSGSGNFGYIDHDNVVHD